jgi:pSer/pThr/pTyr-binding forkhead associated (FHA) protein
VLCLPDPAVSRTHAVLIQTPTELVIRDLGSCNGMRLNGRSIVDAVLPAVAVVEIGPYRLNVCGDLLAAQAEAEGAEDTTRNLPIPVLTSRDRERREQQLTPAQRRVYDEFLRGRSEKDAAHDLGISINTVHTHSHAIYVKCGVSSRA